MTTVQPQPVSQGIYPSFQQGTYSYPPQGNYPPPQGGYLPYQGAFYPPPGNYQYPPPPPPPFNATTQPINSYEESPPSYSPYPMDDKSRIPFEKKDQLTEIKEALMVADTALTHLYAAKKYLKRAYNWGIFDIIGGDLIVTLVKQGVIRNANRELTLAKESLNKLNEELKDVELDNVKISDFLIFSDFVFDCLISDIFVQDKINKAKIGCKKTIVQVETLKKELEAKLNKLSMDKI